MEFHDREELMQIGNLGKIDTDIVVNALEERGFDVEKFKKNEDEKLSHSIDELNLSTRSRTVLDRAEVRKIGEIYKFQDKRDLMHIYGCGKMCLEDIITALEEYGLDASQFKVSIASWKMEPIKNLNLSADVIETLRKKFNIRHLHQIYYTTDDGKKTIRPWIEGDVREELLRAMDEFGVDINQFEK